MTKNDVLEKLRFEKMLADTCVPRDSGKVSAYAHAVSLVEQIDDMPVERAAVCIRPSRVDSGPPVYHSRDDWVEVGDLSDSLA